MVVKRTLRLGTRKETEQVKPQVAGRTVEQILKLTKELGAEAVAKTLTQDERDDVVRAAKIFNTQQKMADSNYKALRAVVFQYAKLNQLKQFEVGDLVVKSKQTSSFSIQPIVVAQELLKRKFSDDPDVDKKRKADAFNKLFSVNLTEARRMFGEELLESLGGTWEVDAFSNVDIK